MSYVKFITIIVLIFKSSIAIAQVDESTCWQHASTVDETYSFKDSCSVQLSIIDYGIQNSATLVIDNKLSGCKNPGIFGGASRGFIKIDVNFSSMSRLEESGIAGRIKKNVVNKTITGCSNLDRIGITYVDSVYLVPHFVKWLPSSTTYMLITYSKESVDIEKALKNLRKIVQKTNLQIIRVRTKTETSLLDQSEKIKKNRNFRMIEKMVKCKKNQISFFDIRTNGS